MKFIILSYLIIQSFFLTRVYSQQRVTTKICNYRGEGMELVNVSLLQNEHVLSSKFTDSLGFCEFTNLKNGEYVFQISQYGIISEKKLFLSKDTSVIIEMEKSKQLEAATINSKKSVFKRKADRMIFNVENSLVSYGNNLYNMLAITPGVKVNENSVTIVGKGEAIIYVDDRVVQLAGEDLINYLYNVPSDDVSKIEVITSPPAKYQAEGSGGIINIAMKSVLKKGYSGDVNSSLTRNTYWSESLGAGINYNKNKIIFKNRINWNQTVYQYSGKINMQFPTSNNLNATKAKIAQSGFNNNADLTYKINDKSRVVLSSQISTSRPLQSNVTNINYIRNTKVDSVTRSLGDGSATGLSSNTGLNYVYILDTLGKKMSIDYNYFTYGQSKNRLMNSHTEFEMSPNYLSQIISSSKQQVKTNSVDLDFELPFQKFAISTGMRASSIENLNDFGNDYNVNNVLTLSEKDRFLYNENIQALYFSFSSAFRKLEFSAGLRAENSIIKSHSYTYNQQNNYSYLKLFPSLYALYTLKEEVYVGLNYTRRIDRPNYAELNPFRLYLNANQYSIGNPYLRPSFADNLELFYMYKDNFSTSLNYAHNSNLYGQIPIVDVNTNTQVYTNINFLTTDLYTLSTMYSLKNKWLQSDIQGNVSYSEAYSNSKITYSSLKGFSSNINLSNQIKTPIKRLSMTLSGMYSFPGITGLVKMESYYTINSGFMYRSKNRKFVFGLTLSDIFRSMRPNMQMYSNGVLLDVVNYKDSRCVRFSLTYNFGNNKVQVDDQVIKNEEEIDRTKE